MGPIVRPRPGGCGRTARTSCRSRWIHWPRFARPAGYPNRTRPPTQWGATSVASAAVRPRPCRPTTSNGDRSPRTNSKWPPARRTENCTQANSVWASGFGVTALRPPDAWWRVPTAPLRGSDDRQPCRSGRAGHSSDDRRTTASLRAGRRPEAKRCILPTGRKSSTSLPT